MIDWLKIEKAAILMGIDEKGNRYLSQFLKDYKNTFNPQTINAGCPRCLEDYYLKFTKYLLKMGSKKEKSDFVLKNKYNGIPEEFGSQNFVNNSNIDETKAVRLIKSNPKGKDLFEKLPENIDELLKQSDDSGNETLTIKQLSKFKRPKLDEMAENIGLEPLDYENKGAVAKAVFDRNLELSNTNVDTEEEE